MPKTVVSYIRVSTTGQGRSGLGLEAQREAIARFARDQNYMIAAEYVEVESAKGADALERRPELGREPINLQGVRLARVRYAPITTKLRSAAKCRDGPNSEVARFLILLQSRLAQAFEHP